MEEYMNVIALFNTVIQNHCFQLTDITLNLQSWKEITHIHMKIYIVRCVYTRVYNIVL